MALFSEAIEYYGANDDHEMCIDLNMRMQSILVRPYILDSLSEHNHISQSEHETMKEKLGGDDGKTNFENDKRRASNPFKYNSNKEFEYEEKPKRSSVAQPRRVGIIS